ncbi:Hypothetical predicted protein, partial [Pelobates cultripes]
RHSSRPHSKPAAEPPVTSRSRGPPDQTKSGHVIELPNAAILKRSGPADFCRL